MAASPGGPRQGAAAVLIERLKPSKAGHPETCAAVPGRARDRILPATDLPAPARSAADAAVQLADPAGHMDCLTVLADNPAERTGQAAQDDHRELCHRLVDGGAKAGSPLEREDPLTTIARIGQVAYRRIKVGKHGRNRAADEIIGSTAAKLCGVARRPALMLPLQEE